MRAVSESPKPVALRRYLPDPTRLWICGCPLSWPGAEGLWSHLAERRLGSPRIAGLPSGEVPRIDSASTHDLLYLPPVDPARQGAFDDLVQELERASVSVLTQRRPGAAVARQTDVLDLLESLLIDGPESLRGIETNQTTAVWPLIAGLTDDPDDWQTGLTALAAAGLSTVVPLALDLDPGDSRRLADFTDEGGYQALFHGARPDDRAFARAAARHGLAAFPRRPDVAGNERDRFSRCVAAELAHAAELWLRLGRAEAAGQELLRASRWTDRSKHDLRALAREGNLEVVPWLDAQSRGVVADLAAGRSSSLCRELEEEYLGE
jgi:hypothetical protein